MPGARTHDIITVATGIALAPLAYSSAIALKLAPEQALSHSALLVGAHMLSGIMFSPDLDLDSAIDNRWGIFFWIWRPYMWAVPHRSRWLSHGLIVPPLLRLLYFYVMIVACLVGVAWALGQVGISVPDLQVRFSDAVFGVVRAYPSQTWAFLIGFMTGGAAHTLADWLVTGGKRYIHRLGFRIVYDYSDHDSWRNPYYRRRRARY